MSGTIRDYCLSEKRYGMIVSISPYSKYDAEGKPSPFQNFGKEIRNFLPRDLHWSIEEDYDVGGRHYQYTKPSPIQKIYEPVIKKHYEYTDDKSKYFYENIKDYDNIKFTYWIRKIIIY